MEISPLFLLNSYLISHPAQDLSPPASSARILNGYQADERTTIRQQNSMLQDMDEQERLTYASVAVRLSELEYKCRSLKQDNRTLQLKTLALQNSLRKSRQGRDDLNGVCQHQRKREEILEARHLALLEESDTMRKQIEQIQGSRMTKVRIYLKHTAGLTQIQPKFVAILLEGATRMVRLIGFFRHLLIAVTV